MSVNVGSLRRNIHFSGEGSMTDFYVWLKAVAQHSIPLVISVFLSNVEKPKKRSAFLILGTHVFIFFICPFLFDLLIGKLMSPNTLNAVFPVMDIGYYYPMLAYSSLLFTLVQTIALNIFVNKARLHDKDCFTHFAKWNRLILLFFVAIIGILVFWGISTSISIYNVMSFLLASCFIVFGCINAASKAMLYDINFSPRNLPTFISVLAISSIIMQVIISISSAIFLFNYWSDISSTVAHICLLMVFLCTCFSLLGIFVGFIVFVRSKLRNR